MVRKYSYPEVAVGAIIVNRKGEIFLAKSYKFQGFYIIPGGHVELGETVADATLRECLEETGLKVRFGHVIDVQEAINPEGFHEKGRHFIFIDVMCRASSSKAKLDGRELHEYCWMKPEKALKARLTTYTRRAIKDFAEGKRGRWYNA